MRKYLFLLLPVILTHASCAQDPERLKSEVERIVKRQKPGKQKNAVLFTGSSSIRLWKDLEERFPTHSIINTGFGGSHMSDLLYWADELVIRYHPSKILIYEGDNDLGEGKAPEQILSDAEKLLSLIRNSLGEDIVVIFITPKPSIVRWHLREKYEQYIAALKSWKSKHRNVEVIDVWSPMLDSEGDLRKELFIEDDLHMNEQGYDIWEETIRPFMNAG